MPNRYSRRDWLFQAGCGFGGLAFASLASANSRVGTALPHNAPDHEPRVKRIIFLFMQGGVSHVDSFDYKPRLIADDGKQFAFDDARIIANTGKRATTQRVMKPLWSYRQHGETGHWASALFPNLNRQIDRLCFIHSLSTEGVAHGPATLFLHCGATTLVRPSIGSWLLYGLGTENQNLPGFVSIAPSTGNGGSRNYGSAFLPSRFQGTPLGTAGGALSEMTFRNLTSTLSKAEANTRYDLIREMNLARSQVNPGDSELEAVTKSYELAWRMQNQAPDVLDLNRESEATRKLYGIGEKHTDTFGKQCLMARRLSESGVRFVQVTYGDNSANPAWDQHSNMPKHADHARAVDQPIAGLLTDLAERGLLEDTLVWWCGEFGRTPYAEKNGTGRDHNPGGFTTWLAGAGVRSGFSLGATDEFGHLAVQDKVHMHDLHATILHLMGLDHEKLTFRYSGRDFRLTDVHGSVIKPILQV